MLTDAQLAARKHGIGGSEIAAILGESRFATPFDVWLAKTKDWAVPASEDMLRGSFLESGIANWYTHRFGYTAADLVEPGTLRHVDHAIALCTPDRLVRKTRLLSIKAPRRGGDLWGEPGTDNVPCEYLLQLQWEHAICSSLGPVDDEMHLAALLDGDLAVYITHADRELQAWMLDAAREWWLRHVIAGEQPSLDGSSQAREWLKKKFPKDAGETRPARPHEIRLCVELQMAEAEAKRWESACETLRNEIKLSMGTASSIESTNGVVNWRANVKGIRSFKPRWTKEK